MRFRMTAAACRARELREECGLDDPLGIPMETIILGRGAFYEERPLGAKDGEIISVGDRSIISINSSIPFACRKRYAAAHELGHYELHRQLRPRFSDTAAELLNWYKSGVHEREANEFAAEFLMPSDLFRQECNNKAPGPGTIAQLASRFGVTKTSAILRYVERGSRPVFVVCCHNNKMKWWKRSEDFPHYSLFEYNAAPPPGSVARELFAGNTRYYGEEAKQAVRKSDWFQLKKGEKDAAFYEYCLHVDAYNYTISVIWEQEPVVAVIH